MNIYLDNGYLDIKSIRNSGYPIIIIIGGRGTGKTYGALKTVAESKEDFILLRRLQKQIDLCKKPKLSPFNSINADCGTNIVVPAKGNTDVLHFVDDDTGNSIGIGLALSTVANIRGLDDNTAKLIIFDEFVKKSNERPIKDEGENLFDFYETINRNRELKGEKPVQLLCLSNSNQLANELFIYLGLVGVVDRLHLKGIFPAVWRSPERGILLVDLGDSSEISKQKKNTAMYKALGNNAYSEMALKNEYHAEKSNIKSMPLREYKCVWAIGELAGYRHKSTGEWFVSLHKSGAPKEYTSGNIGIMRFKSDWYSVRLAYLENKILFESYTAESLLTKYIGLV